MAEYEKGARHEVDLNAHKIISGDSKITQKETIVEVGKAVGNFGDLVLGIVTSPLKLIKWFADNWQIAIVGLIALLVLFRD